MRRTTPRGFVGKSAGRYAENGNQNEKKKEVANPLTQEWQLYMIVRARLIASRHRRWSAISQATPPPHISASKGESVSGYGADSGILRAYQAARSPAVQAVYPCETLTANSVWVLGSLLRYALILGGAVDLRTAGLTR